MMSGLQPLGNIDNKGQENCRQDVDQTPPAPGLQFPEEMRLADSEPPLHWDADHQVDTDQETDQVVHLLPGSKYSYTVFLCLPKD